MKLQNVIVQLRKICNHPFLFDLSDDSLTADDNNSKNSISNNADGKIVDMADIIKWSGKMVILERMIPELFKKGHKVLIFSQMTRMLDILADWCEFVKGWKFCRIDGQVHIDIRREQVNNEKVDLLANPPSHVLNIQKIKAFDSDPECRLFLLSTRAGGLGINLTAADTVIIFDSDWNPQMDLQAQDRVHRIGQTKPVIVYRLVTRDTVESMILEK